MRLTQRQPAEKLGVSDKSVSKRERGVCLPDVSLYMELCGILGISLNEFLAGEDINDSGTTVKKSEADIIGAAESGERRQRKMPRVIALLAAVLIVCAASSL